MTNIPNLSSAMTEGDATKKSKRRSLLPQFSRKTSEEREEGAQIREEVVEDNDESGRPNSEDAGVSSVVSRRTAIDEDRRTIPPPSKLSRPASMIPPRGASQYSKTKLGRAHTRDDSNEKEDNDQDTARADSLAALTGAAPTPEPAPAPAPKPSIPESGLKRSGSTRLPQTSKIGAPAIPSRTTSNRTKHTHSRTISKMNENTTAPTISEESTATSERQPKSRDAAVQNRKTDRTKQSHTRSISKLDNGMATAAISEEMPVTASEPPQSTDASPPPQTTDETSPPVSQRSSVVLRPRPTSQMPQPTSPQRSTAVPRSRPVSQVQPLAPPKPAFNTYQQHYSPAKSGLPKPPIPAARTTSKRALHKEVEDDNVSFDTAKQQIELLQLSLLHQAATKCMQEYTASAKRKLGKKHAKLRKEYESIRASELVHQRAANLAALETWCPDPGLLVENLQILSLVYSDLTSLMEEGSRHGDVVSMFELWMSEAEAPEPGSFVQPLPDDWKAAHASLTLKLRSIQRNIRVLPPVQPAGDGDERSGLEIILKGCKTLVDEMSKELEVMSKLEKEMLARERNRVENEVKALMNDDVNVKSNWTPAWQKVA